MSTTTTYLVQGMTCGHCAQTVAAGIQSLDAVTAADVDLEAGTVAVESAGPIADEDVAAAVAEAGYTFGGRS
ncbi:cation transporter [Microbacterium paludicola]|uniref:cation transporter n=1 Tax=Microbacterium paludicola TaxID=300019 RepID=UPI0031DE0F60